MDKMTREIRTVRSRIYHFLFFFLFLPQTPELFSFSFLNVHQSARPERELPRFMLLRVCLHVSCFFAAAGFGQGSFLGRP